MIEDLVLLEMFRLRPGLKKTKQRIYNFHANQSHSRSVIQMCHLQLYSIALPKQWDMCKKSIQGNFVKLICRKLSKGHKQFHGQSLTRSRFQPCQVPFFMGHQKLNSLSVLHYLQHLALDDMIKKWVPLKNELISEAFFNIEDGAFTSSLHISFSKKPTGSFQRKWQLLREIQGCYALRLSAKVNVHNSVG